MYQKANRVHGPGPLAGGHQKRLVRKGCEILGKGFDDAESFPDAEARRGAMYFAREYKTIVNAALGFLAISQYADTSRRRQYEDRTHLADASEIPPEPSPGQPRAELGVSSSRIWVPDSFMSSPDDPIWDMSEPPYLKWELDLPMAQALALFLERQKEFLDQRWEKKLEHPSYEDPNARGLRHWYEFREENARLREKRNEERKPGR